MSKLKHESIYLYIGGILTILFLIIFMHELGVSLHQQSANSPSYYFG